MSLQKEFTWGRDGSAPDILPHSEAKLRVYRDYLRRYFHIVTRKTRTLRMAIVDGFAGGGYFNKRGEVIPGSPLIILEEMERAQRVIIETENRPVVFQVDCHFIDSNPNHTKALKDHLREKGYGGRIGRDIHIHTGKFNDQVENIASLIRASSPRAGRAILFLDQAGYTAVNLDEISGLFTQFEHIEILLTWAVDWFIDYLTDKKEFLKAAQGSGISEEQVRFLGALKDNNHRRAILQNHISNFIKERFRNSFYAPFFVKSPSSHRALWVIHASKNPRARDAMIETHWDVTNTSVSHGPAGVIMPGFVSMNKLGDILPLEFEPDREKEIVSAISDDLPKILVDNYSREAVFVHEFRTDQMNAGSMGAYRHLDLSIQQARRAQRLEVLTEAGSRKKSGAKLLKNDRIMAARTRSFFNGLQEDE